MKKEQTVCSETLAHKIQMPGNDAKERIQHSEHGKRLKSRFKERSYTSIPPLGLHGLF
jgi:hypothetical protein